jgi:hypothetical protein
MTTNQSVWLLRAASQPADMLDSSVAPSHRTALATPSFAPSDLNYSLSGIPLSAAVLQRAGRAGEQDEEPDHITFHNHDEEDEEPDHVTFHNYDGEDEEPAPLAIGPHSALAPAGNPPRAGVAGGPDLVKAAGNILDADSTGPNTGLAGTLGEGGTLTNNPDYYTVGDPSKQAAASFASGIGGGLADTASILSGIRSVVKHGPAIIANDRSQTDAAQINARSETRGGAANVAINSADLGGNRLPNAITVGSNLASSSASAGLATAAAVTGPLVSGVVMLRSGRRAVRAHNELNHLKAIGAVNEHSAGTKAYLEAQLKERRLRAGIGAAGAAIGVAGGATAMTPAGWALAATSGLISVGLGAYKAGRWVHKRSNGTLGVKRRAEATNLRDNARSADGAVNGDAKRILGAIGLTPDQVAGDAGVELIMRKMKSQ